MSDTHSHVLSLVTNGSASMVAVHADLADSNVY